MLYPIELRMHRGEQCMNRPSPAQALFAPQPDSKLQTPNPNLQINPKRQAQKPTAPRFAPGICLGVPCLRFGTSLEFGGLVLGVSLSGGSKKILPALPSPNRCGKHGNQARGCKRD